MQRAAQIAGEFFSRLEIIVGSQIRQKFALHNITLVVFANDGNVTDFGFLKSEVVRRCAEAQKLSQSKFSLSRCGRIKCVRANQ